MPTPEQIDITLTTLSGQTSPADVKNLISALRSMHRDYPISEFLFRLEGPPENLQYSYKIELYDGRSWNQEMDFSVLRNDPTMNFAVDDFWSLSEFAPHREIRNAVVALMQESDIELIEYTGGQA